MENSSSKKVASLLRSENRDLQFILGKVKVLQDLNSKVAAYFDPHLAKGCQVANLQGSKLLIMVADGSLATQLRFLTTDLLRKFKTDPDPRLQKVQEIQCKVHPGLVLPNFARGKEMSNKMSPLSPETAQFLQELASSLDDPKLKEIMKRIAGRSS